MFKTYWAMESNPFSKNTDINCFKSSDFKAVTSRFKYLLNTKGIGLFTGVSGSGKTYTLKKLTDELNPGLYKVIYTPLSTITVLDFYKSLAYGLGLEPKYRKVDLFKQIQEKIITQTCDLKITPVIIIDEAQYLKTEILNDLKIILNFNMDSKSHIVLLIVGQPLLNNILSKTIHEAIAQRIIVNYNMGGFSKEELINYIDTSFTSCGIANHPFNHAAIEALFATTSSSIRKLNTIIERCLILGFQQKTREIDHETVMHAHSEISIG